MWKKGLLSLILVLLLAGTVSIHAEEGILGYHTVMPGETIYCIARAYGVSPWEIALRNHLIRIDLIHTGDRLAVPATPMQVAPGPTCRPQFFSPYADPSTSCRFVHTVMRGDTLSAIGRHYGVNVWTLASYNRLADPDMLRVGEQLCIP